MTLKLVHDHGVYDMARRGASRQRSMSIRIPVDPYSHFSQSPSHSQIVLYERDWKKGGNYRLLALPGTFDVVHSCTGRLDWIAFEHLLTVLFMNA